LTDMDITYIFIRYISVTIKRQARAFYLRYNKIFYYENREYIENIDMETEEVCSISSNSFCRNIEDKLSYRDLLFKGLNSLQVMEKQLIYEKFLNQRSDADIGRDFSISSQMVSRRKRKILYKLKNFF
jgi:DNA-directed RNA polymerase specialized sigma subunit